MVTDTSGAVLSVAERLERAMGWFYQDRDARACPSSPRVTGATR